MKTKVGKVVLVISMAIAAIFTQKAYGGTTHVFCQYLGNIASPSQTQLTSYANFLANNNIDFGVFYGATSAANFGLVAEGYTAVTTITGDFPGRTLVYKTSAWEIAHHYDLAYNTSYFIQTEAYVMQNKTTGEQVLFVMPTCTKASGLGKTSGAAVARNYTNGKKGDYPSAVILMAIPYTKGLKNEDSNHYWNADLTGNGYVRTLSVSNVGAVFAKDANITSYSGADVTCVTVSGSDSKAATATVSRRMPCTVVFQDWDGTELKTETVLEGGNATPPDDPERVGHHFSGWSDSYENIQGNTTLVAQYNPDMFTVRFLDWDGEVLKSELVAYGTDATPPADPTREGWRFIGWNASYTGITAATDITALYADASTVTHWVTFEDWDGTQLSRQEVLDGQNAVPPADPTREGWHFTGWSGTYTGVMQDETVTATYAINAYEIVFTDWDGAVLKTQTVAHGSDATPPADPSRTGYHFTGWQGAYQNVQGAATVVAQYEINVYTVTFKYENGTVISSQQVPYQGAATKPADPAPLNEGDIFYKWSCSFSSITADLEVVAMFVNKIVEISTGAQFAEYMDSSLANNTAITFAFTTDISLSGVSYSKPSTFKATLDGRGHTLKSFPSNKDIRSLCSTLDGTIRDLCIANYNAPGNANKTSILAESAQGAMISGVVLSNCTWTITGGSHGTAGLVYSVGGNTTITNCTMVNCKVTASSNGTYLGGFVGSASSLLMVDCHFIADDANQVAVGDGIPVAGALIGKCGSGVTVRRCSNNARVKVSGSASEAAAGGLVGGSWSNSGSPVIEDCANFGIVEATSNVPAGGIIGEVGPTNANFTVTVKSCYNYGSVSSPFAAGGIIGSYRGASKTIVNCGNAGNVSSPAGYAGGIIGRLRYYGSNGTAGFENVFQCGAVTTESGLAGILAGGITSSTGSGLTLVVNNAWMAGSATASAGGKTGLAIGGCDAESTGALALSVTGGGVLNSNAALAAGYDAAGQQIAWTGDAPTSFASTALVDMTILEALNAEARSRNVTRWIPGEEFPELETFGTENSPGMIMMCW